MGFVGVGWVVRDFGGGGINAVETKRRAPNANLKSLGMKREIHSLTGLTTGLS